MFGVQSKLTEEDNGVSVAQFLGVDRVFFGVYTLITTFEVC
jgi:hypothetical protein